MTAKRIDGRKISKQLQEQLKKEVAVLVENGITPGLAVVLVGDDPASQTYVRRKTKLSKTLGIHSVQHTLPENTSQQELLSLITTLNQDTSLHGILVQLPLPSHIDESAIINAIDPKKDVDAFSPVNVGAIMIGDYTFAPCTPAGIMELLKAEDISVEGKDCVVIGRSNIVGKPMAMLLLHANGTVTMCHSRTKDLAAHCKKADILVAAVGQADFVTADMIKPGAVVIDVGMNRGKDGALCGDVAFEEVSKVAGYITPVPGGVGPMTIVTLMKNTLRAAECFGTPSFETPS